MCKHTFSFTFFFFNDTATTEIYTLSLHDAFPIFAAVDESARLLFEKFCSPSTFSSAARSITEYFPSLTSFITSKSEMPLPTSWLVPKMACTEFITVPYSKLITATRFFGPCGCGAAAGAEAGAGCCARHAELKSKTAQTAMRRRDMVWDSFMGISVAGP